MVVSLLSEGMRGASLRHRLNQPCRQNQGHLKGRPAERFTGTRQGWRKSADVQTFDYRKKV
jgi:hypothetical protein